MALKETFNNNDILPDVDSWLLPRANGMLLSDHHIDVLERNNINFMDYKDIASLLFAINEMDMDDELEEVACDLDEKNYYSHLEN